MAGKGKQQEETAAQKAMMEFATKQYRDYKVRWLPVQQHLASVIETNHGPDSAARKLAVGKAATDSKIAFAKARTGVEASLANSGVAPGSARSNLALGGVADDEAAAIGTGHMIADQQADDAYTQGLSALTALGRGDKANAAEGLTRSAALSAGQAQRDAEASLNERAGYANLVGTGVGAAFGSPRKSGGDMNIDYNGMSTNNTGMSLPTRGGA